MHTQGKLLSKWREKNGLSQRQLAAMLRVTQAFVCKFEGGQEVGEVIAIRLEQVTKGVVRAELAVLPGRLTRLAEIRAFADASNGSAFEQIVTGESP